MKTILELNDLAFPIKLEASRSGRRFRVTYGKQIKPQLTYSDAAKELGECILHALACDGKLNDDEGTLLLPSL